MKVFASAPRSLRPTRRPARAVTKQEEGAPTHTLFDTPAYRVLRALHREGPLNMRRFTEASGHAPRHAKILRDELEEAGTITVEEEKRGVSGDMKIGLTALGHKVAEKSYEIEALLDGESQE